MTQSQMRLKLTCRTVANGNAARNWRTLENGELTLGRGAACGWRFPDASPEMSKVQCRITGNGRGFTIRDESVNGVCVDGRDLVEGQTVPLRNGSAIRFCGLEFSAEITGEIVPDWEEPDATLPFGDDALSITAILADIAPTGNGVRGPLPARDGGDILADVSGRNGAPRDPVLPGWSGPPDASPLGSAIPDDWNLAPSESSSRTEHMAATSARMRLPHKAIAIGNGAADVLPGPVRGADGQEAALAFLAAARLPLPEGEDPVELMRSLGMALRATLDDLAAMERETAEFLADLGLDPGPSAFTRPATDAEAIGEAASAQLADQRRLHEALRVVFTEWRRDFDPRRIEAAGAEEPSGIANRFRTLLPGAAAEGAWARYRASFEARGGLEERLGDALRRGETNSAAEFEELSSDQTIAGDVR